MKQTETPTTSAFPNLFAAYVKEKEGSKAQQIAALDVYETKEKMLDNWWNRRLIPASSKYRKWKDLAELKAYLTARIEKWEAASVEKQRKHLEAVAAAPDFVGASVSVEWKKSHTWGKNPNADARVDAGNLYEHFSSGSIGGCGYDKESTAIAQALNQSLSFLKMLYTTKEANPEKTNHELFGYGSGYGIFPSLEGGVGVSCYPRIFKAIGFEWLNQASGKTFDVYTVQKASE